MLKEWLETVEKAEKEALYDRVKKSYDQLTINYEKHIESESKSIDGSLSAFYSEAKKLATTEVINRHTRLHLVEFIRVFEKTASRISSDDSITSSIAWKKLKPLS